MAFFLLFLRKKLKILYLRERFTGTNRFYGSEPIYGSDFTFFSLPYGSLPYTWPTGAITGAIGSLPY